MEYKAISLSRQGPSEYTMNMIRREKMVSNHEAIHWYQGEKNRPKVSTDPPKCIASAKDIQQVADSNEAQINHQIDR